MILFQSTLPRGERRASCPLSSSVTVFQSTLPRGERHWNYPRQNHHKKFQSTLPRGERPVCALCTVGVKLFQSTLPRGERHRYIFQPANTQTVSIHAPARGATPFMSLVVKKYLGFNPRSREGSDSLFTGAGQLFYVSIHAPARGATPHLSEPHRSIRVSIHAPARGAT